MAMTGTKTSIGAEEYEAIKKLVIDYRVTKVEEKYQPMYESKPLYQYSRRDPYYDYHTEHMVVKMYSIEIDERALAEIAVKIKVYEDLMQDPETRTLLHEAIFINKLKHGR